MRIPKQRGARCPTVLMHTEQRQTWHPTEFQRHIWHYQNGARQSEHHGKQHRHETRNSHIQARLKYQKRQHAWTRGNLKL